MQISFPAFPSGYQRIGSWARRSFGPACRSLALSRVVPFITSADLCCTPFFPKILMRKLHRCLSFLWANTVEFSQNTPCALVKQEAEGSGPGFFFFTPFPINAWGGGLCPFHSAPQASRAAEYLSVLPDWKSACYARILCVVGFFN